MGCFPERLRISPGVCEGNDPSCLLLQMEEKRRKYSISSENSDTTDSKALLPGAPIPLIVRPSHLRLLRDSL